MPLSLRAINPAGQALSKVPHELYWGGSLGSLWSLEGETWAGKLPCPHFYHSVAKLILLGCHFVSSHPLIIPQLAFLFISHQMGNTWLHLEGPSKLHLPYRSSIIHRKCHLSALTGHWCQLHCSHVNISKEYFHVFSHAASEEVPANLHEAASLPSFRHCWKLFLTEAPVTASTQGGCCHAVPAGSCAAHPVPHHFHLLPTWLSLLSSC